MAISSPTWIGSASSRFPRTGSEGESLSRQTGSSSATNPKGIRGSSTSQSTGNPRADAAAIEALLKYEHYGNWSFENGARSFRSLRIALDRWAADVKAKLETIREQNKFAFENAVHALALGSIVCGLVDARSSGAVELINAIFESIPESPSHAEGPWEELQLACARGGGGRRDSREALQVRVTEFAGTSKGGSGPQMIDAATILPVLLARVDDLETTPATSGRDGASQHLKHVLELLPQAVEARREHLQRVAAHNLGVVRPRTTRCRGCRANRAGHCRPCPLRRLSLSNPSTLCSDSKTRWGPVHFTPPSRTCGVRSLRGS